MRFSPDGHSLVGVDALQIVTIDVSSGVTDVPTYSGNGADFPDWSPDGHFIVYNRKFYFHQNPPQPLDSAGIHIFDTLTGADNALKSNGAVLTGFEPRWSPDGQWIAFVSFNGDAVQLVHPDGSGLRTIYQAPMIDGFQDLHWYRRHFSGLCGVIFRGVNSGSHFVSAIDLQATTWRPFASSDDFGPDGEDLVTIARAPRDSFGVLFTQLIDDVSGASRRQITSFSPAPGTAAALTSQTRQP